MKKKIKICLVYGFFTLLFGTLKSQSDTAVAGADTVQDQSIEKSIKAQKIEPHSLEDLVANYNGYVTNYINVVDADVNNLIIKVLKKRKHVKWLLEGYSHSSIVLLNAILNKEITDENFIEEYLEYTEFPFLKGIELTLDSGESYDLEFVTSTPDRGSLLSDICLLHLFAPDSVLPQDQIFFDAIKSAYAQIEEGNFRVSNGNTGSKYLYSDYSRSNKLGQYDVKPIFTYYDSTRERILKQFGKHATHAKIAFDNLEIKKDEDRGEEDIYFETINQKLALQNIWNQDSLAFVILEVFNSNLCKKELDSVKNYQVKTLVQELESDKTIKHKMASVGQLSLLEENQSKMQSYNSKPNGEDVSFNAILDEYYFGDDTLIYNYFDYLDENQLDFQNHFSVNERNVWQRTYKDDENIYVTDVPKYGTRLFLSAGYMVNGISSKNMGRFSTVNLPTEYNGYNFTIGLIDGESGIYFSFYNAGDLNSLYFRHFEYAGIGIVPLSEKLGSYLEMSIPFRYSSASLVNPFDLGYFSSPNIENNSVEIAKTNGLSVGFGLKYMVFPLRFWSIGAEAKYYSNSIYKTRWKVDSKLASNLNSFNFRGFQFGVSSSIYLNNL